MQVLLTLHHYLTVDWLICHNDKRFLAIQNYLAQPQK